MGFFLLLAWSLFTHQTNDFATHQPVLYEMVLRTTGPVLECGCGDGSTDLLHELCKKTQRTLITLDDDFAWLWKFAQKYQSDAHWHHFLFVPGKRGGEDPQHWIRFFDSSGILDQWTFDVCFIDQSPWLARFETIRRVKDKARYVILHDCDYFPVHGIFGTVISPLVWDYGDLFRSFKVYFPLKPWPYVSGPPTLVGSNFEEHLPEIHYEDY